MLYKLSTSILVMADIDAYDKEDAIKEFNQLIEDRLLNIYEDTGARYFECQGGNEVACEKQEDIDEWKRQDLEYDEYKERKMM